MCDKSESEAYAECTALTWIFGDHPRVRIIAALISEPDNSLPIDDIIELAGISRGIFQSEIVRLKEHNVVNEIQSSGQTKTYTINTESNTVEYIRIIEGDLLRKWYETQGEK